MYIKLLNISHRNNKHMSTIHIVKIKNKNRLTSLIKKIQKTYKVIN